MNKYVCIDNRLEEKNLTLGKIYLCKIEEEEYNDVKIISTIDDSNRRRSLLLSRFKTIEDIRNEKIELLLK